MHLTRLLLSGIMVLREGYVPVRVDQHREPRLAFRRGEITWPDMEQWRLSLHREFETACDQTKLADRPDYERANAFLIKARRAALDGPGGLLRIRTNRTGPVVRYRSWGAVRRDPPQPTSTCRILTPVFPPAPSRGRAKLTPQRLAPAIENTARRPRGVAIKSTQTGCCGERNA
jgi:hypothetical protein